MAGGAGGGEDTIPSSDESRDGVRGPAARSAGQFHVLEPLGRGGMGTVWRARDEVLLRDVALKRLAPQRAQSPAARVRMLREARAQAAISHPNVCTIYQAGEDDEGVWIAMELLPGPTLAEKLRDAPLAPAQVASWGVQIARALGAAHARGLVHRDLKPGNVMLDGAGHVKVTDFGLVKLVDVDPSGDASTASPELGGVLTRDGEIMGSPRYMSPEQARGVAVATPSDVFSLGVVLYELLTGTPPFAGTTTMEMLAAIMRDDPPPLAARAPLVPASLAAIVHACLAKDEAARPTVPALIDALAAPLSHARRRRWPWIAAGLGACAAVAAIVLAWPRGGGSAAPPAPVPAAEPIAIGDATDVVPTAAYDPSGRTLYFVRRVGTSVVSFDGAGRLWRSTDHGAPQPVAGVANVRAVTCCNGGQLAIADDKGIELLDPRTGAVTPARDLGALGTTLELALSPDGRWAAGVNGAGLTIVDRTLPSRSWTLPPVAGQIARALRWSPDSRRLAYRTGGTAWSRTEEVRVIDAVRDPSASVVAGSVDTSGLARQPFGLAWLDADHLIVLAGGSGPQWVRYTLDAGGRAVEHASRDLGGRALEPLASNGRELAFAETRRTGGVHVAELGAHLGPAQDLGDDPFDELGGWLPDGRLVLSHLDPEAHTVEVMVQLPGEPPVVQFAEDPHTVARPLAVIDGTIVYAKERQGADRAELWRGGVDAGKLLDVGPDALVACGDSPAARCALTDGRHTGINDLDLAKRTIGATVLGDAVGFRAIAVSPDGRRVVGAGSTGLMIYDRRTRTIAQRTLPDVTAIGAIEYGEGDDLIVATDQYSGGLTYPQVHDALLLAHGTGALDVLATSDQEIYLTPRYDRARHRLAFVTRGHATSLFVEPTPTF